jgi:hypothetical protein
MSLLAGWETFYVIMGSAAAVLTGLTFIAMTLGAETQLPLLTPRAIAAFTTPTIVYFGGALFLSAVLSAPWPRIAPLALLLGICGLAGALYTLIIIRRQLRLDVYTPVLEDWLWFTASPLVAYLALVVGAALLPGNPEPALFVIAGVVTLLLFNGMRNAWYSVTYIATRTVLGRPL